MLNDNGIAWMIAGGAREGSRDDHRQLLHRIALAESRPPRTDGLRRWIAGVRGVRDDSPAALATLSTDCCPA
ncbi:MAG: hypothetical protein K0S97_846 [Chloroflexota bacterium]|jgi:hypothetical protein|nr:hypothetical protein [Chloroflexota bacterium]